MDRVCRVCMSGAGELIDIFITDAESPSLEEMINECVNVKIKRDDPYPKQICEICMGDVHCAYRFKKNYQLTLEQFNNSNPLNISEENTLPGETEERNETLTSEIDKGSTKTKIKKKNVLKVPKKYLKDKSKRIKLILFGVSSQEESPKKKTVHERTKKTGTKACKICGKVFAMKVSLTKHMNSHKKNSLHKCPHCTRRFNEIVDLSAHLALHSASGGFKCPHCHKDFGLKHNLKRHLITRVCTKDAMGVSEKVNIADKSQ